MSEYLMSSREDIWGNKPLQNCILQIARYIDIFCEGNSIEYCLMGGSALGAIRHNGFIPWDDDLDLFMTVDNYERFRTLFSKLGDHQRYYLQELGECKGMVCSAKVRLNNSTYIEPVVAGMDIHHGVFVDIFILHACPNNRFLRYIQYFWGRYIVIKGMANRKNNRGGILRRSIVSLFKLLPKRFLLGFSLKQLYRYRGTDTDYYCHFMGRAGIKRGVYEKNLFCRPIRHDFELIQLNIPYDSDKYLEERYGNYMKLPNESEILYFQHTTEWDIEKPFEPRKNGTYEDEKYYF